MKIYIALFCLFAVVCSAGYTKISNQEKEFSNWLGLQNKMYDTWDEFYSRLEIFHSNFQKASISHPSQMNQFGDLEESEFLSTYTGYKGERKNPRNEVYFAPTSNAVVDWRTKGAVTPVKDQGGCGSCWAFSTTGSLEGAYFLKHGSLKSFSEQELVDCSTSYGNQGCGGGLMDQAFEYVKAKGDESESDYTYQGTDGTCRADSSKVAVTVASYADVKSGDCDQLKAALDVAPVSVAVEANMWWQFYYGGVSNACGTSTKASSLNHGVLAVGYEDGQYWIVKNSWGSGWGESGYIRLAWGNECGICLDASTPSVQ